MHASIGDLPLAGSPSVAAMSHSAEDGAVPAALLQAAPVFKDAERTLAAIRAVFGGSRFRVYLDDACAMPADWRTRLHVGNASHTHSSTVDDSKYGAESALPHMLAASPYVTDDWRLANASVVVLYAHRFGGPIFGPERCRRMLAQRSAAWRETGGRRHFFIVTSDFGPCDHSGHLLSPALLGHHLIATHGELEGHHWHWGVGPNLPCFCGHKDISIPPANWLSQPSIGSAPPQKELLAFFAGAGEFRSGKRQGRQLMLRIWGNRTDPSILAVPRLSRAGMLRGMARARFCPIFGGNSPWSTRLVEAMMARCVPVFFSSWLPPFSRVLDWERFSVRLASLDLVPHLKHELEVQPYEKLAANLPLALSALWYRVGGYRGDDLLPFLLVEMHMVLRAAAERPLAELADDIIGMPLRLASYDDDVIANRSSAVTEALPERLGMAVRSARHAFPSAFRGGVTIITNRSAAWPSPIVWRCVPVSRNGHSFRSCDPFDVDPIASNADDELSRVESATCQVVHPRSLRSSAHAQIDPLSPTQSPPNYTLVRANREYLKAFRGR